MGTWATAGTATDFTAADGPGAGEETMSRSTTADTGNGRLAALGASNYTDTEVGVTIKLPRGPGDPVMGGAEEEAVIQQGVVARYVDVNNYLVADLYSHTDYAQLLVTLVLAGVPIGVAQSEVGRQSAAKLRLVVRAAGGFTAELLTLSGGILTTVSGSRTELATGGALATGKPGLRDYATTLSARTRYYDDFYAMQPPAEPIAIYGGSLAGVTSDAARRLSSDSSTWGRVPAYRGSYFTIPPAGTNNRKARLAVAVRRNDITVAADEPVTDSITVQTYWTPVFLVVPG